MLGAKKNKMNKTEHEERALAGIRNLKKEDNNKVVGFISFIDNPLDEIGGLPVYTSLAILPCVDLSCELYYVPIFSRFTSKVSVYATRDYLDGYENYDNKN